ncbi:MAG: glycoside hydrolase family 3 C-terminal domain-containing protein [Porticoccaceae bacterium]
MVKIILVTSAAILLYTTVVLAQDAQSSDRHKQRASELANQMTLAEKIGLVTGVLGMPPVGQNTLPPDGAAGGDGFAPGVLRLGVPHVNLIGATLGVTDLGMRANGPATALPSTLAVAASFDTTLARDYGAVIGEETRRKGFNVSLGGGVNLTRDPRGGRTFEYHGEDPLLAGRLVGSELKAIENAGVVATIKHFAANDFENGRFGIDVRVGERALRESELLAFEIGLAESGAGAVMCSYNLLNGSYACENQYLLNEVLKQEWGFEGWVMSDWGAVHSTIPSALAGLDQEFFTQEYFGAVLAKAIKNGEVPQARLDDMVVRIISQLDRVGAFDSGAQLEPIDKEAGARVALRTAELGSVLLKNDNILPLDPNRGDMIAVIGFNADKGVLSGGGSSQVNPIGGNAIPPATPPKSVIEMFLTQVWNPSPPLAAIRSKAKAAKVIWDSGTDISAAVEVSAQADVVIIFAGRHRTEGVDIPDLTLGSGQEDLIAAVANANPNTIVVLETGGAHTMPWLGEVRAVLQAWYPGQEGGEAIANILFGEVNPSGKLPLTFPLSEEDLPRPVLPGPPLAKKAGMADMMNPIRSVVSFEEGPLIGYKWFDATDKKTLFPFGHGLSYTNFGYSHLTVNLDVEPSVSFDLANTGQRDGTEIAQVYVAVPGSNVPRRLAGWVRTKIAAGETKSVTAELEPKVLANWDIVRKRWVMPAGEYTVSVGASSRDLRLAGTVKVKRTRILP